MEELNQELEFKIEQYEAEISLQRKQLQKEQDLCEDLQRELEETKSKLQTLREEFDKRLEEQVNRRSFELELLEDFSSKIGYNLSYEELFHSMLQHLNELVPCDVRGGIIIGAKNCNLYLETNRFLSNSVTEEIKKQLLASLAKINGKKMDKRPLFLHHLNSEKIQSQQSAIETINSHILVPIIADPEGEKEIIGLLFVGDEEKEHFQEDSIRRLYAIAARASISVQQLQLLLVAEQSRLENEKIRENLEKEKQLNNLKLRFIRMISHEYRTPLTTISLASDLLKNQLHRLSKEQQDGCWLKINNAIQHMFNLVEDVLLLERSEGDELELNPVKIDLVLFCLQLVDELQLSAKKNQKIEFNYEGDRTEVYLDKKLLRQILSNLLSNALKYSRADSKIELKLTFARDTLIFSVCDRGIGIPPEDMPRLFEPFHRADNASHLKGTGLGLAIVKKTVELQQGEIGVESKLGVGSTFTVKLPLKTEAD